MLSDARSIWSSLTNAASTINDNIHAAIEKYEDDNNQNEDNPVEELEIYKKLLDEAQMHHVELSQATRLLIAEKDSELKFWKLKSGGEVGDNAFLEGKETNQDLNVEVLIEERDALQETLITLGLLFYILHAIIVIVLVKSRRVMNWRRPLRYYIWLLYFELTIVKH